MLATEGRDDERQRVNDVRRERDEDLPLEQRLADQPEVEVLEVAEPAVDELARPARRPAGVVAALKQGDAVAAGRGVEGDAGARDPAADDDDVELGVRARKCLERRGPGDHYSCASSAVISATPALASANSIDVFGS